MKILVIKISMKINDYDNLTLRLSTVNLSAVAFGSPPGSPVYVVNSGLFGFWLL